MAQKKNNNKRSIQLNLAGTDDFFTQEAYKVLRTNLQFCGDDIHVISLTSCNENEGKTTVSLNLGKCLAELGKKVLVIDADMRKSVMAGRDTTARNVTGLSEILTGITQTKMCIYTTQYPTLDIIFAGKYPPNPVELLNGKRFASLLLEVRETYDYIIIDTPPLGRVIDAAVIAPLCDGTILVLGNDKTKIREAQNVVEQMRRTEARILGVITNNVRRNSKEYYYRKYGDKNGYGEVRNKNDSLKTRIFRIFRK